MPWECSYCCRDVHDEELGYQSVYAGKEFSTGRGPWEYRGAAVAFDAKFCSFSCMQAAKYPEQRFKCYMPRAKAAEMEDERDRQIYEAYYER